MDRQGEPARRICGHLRMWANKFTDKRKLQNNVKTPQHEMGVDLHHNDGKY